MACEPGEAFAVRPAAAGDLAAVAALMDPLMRRGELLPRDRDQLLWLLPEAFVAQCGPALIGFAALVVYSPKLAEIQGLAYAESPPRWDVAPAIVCACAERARALGIFEVLIVAAGHLEAALRECGFHDALPQQKKALFLRPAEVPPGVFSQAVLAPIGEAGIRPATAEDVPALAEFLAPFVARKELLPRRAEELAMLAEHGFIAHVGCRIVGFTAIEFYSRKLAEVQCVSVAEDYRGRGIGKRLVALCVSRARQIGVAEVLAITAREEVLRACGFSECLPGTRTALFLQTRSA